MVVKKKRKPKTKKVKKKSAPAKKPAAGKRRVKKAKKNVSRRPKTRAAKPAAPPAAAPAVPTAPPGEQRIGVVTHYFGHLAVAVVHVEEGVLRVGDTIHVKGHTSDFRQRVESMQVEHASVTEAGTGQSVGLKVADHAREHDVVYKVAAP